MQQSAAVKTKPRQEVKMFRILCISERGVRLSVSDGCLTLSEKHPDQPTLIAPDELDAVILEESAVSVTGSVISLLAEKRIPVIACGPKHLPIAVLNPIIADGADSHNLIRFQIAAAKPWRKQIWQKLIRSKITGQSFNLTSCGKNGFDSLANQVRSGDPDNIEARAASCYWSRMNLFPARNRNAPDANQLFNYAYTILYSAFARYLCAAALNPDLGIHHRSQYNHFSLASDLMEPFRPLVDRCVFRFMSTFPNVVRVQRESRNEILKIIYDARISMNRKMWSLPDAVNLAVHSYKQCLVKQSVDIMLPEVKSCGW